MADASRNTTLAANPHTLNITPTVATRSATANAAMRPFFSARPCPNPGNTRLRTTARATRPAVIYPRHSNTPHDSEQLASPPPAVLARRNQCYASTLPMPQVVDLPPIGQDQRGALTALFRICKDTP